jgi:hypothetical protein
VTEAANPRLTSGLGQYTIAMLACFGLVGVLWLIALGGAKEERLPRVDVGRQAAQFRATAAYQTYAPQNLPAGWRATSSRITGTKADGPIAWHLGYLTGRDEYAALEQSNENPATFIPRMANRDRSVGTQQVAGATWERYFREDKKQFTLARRLPGVTIVVTGTASYDDLAVLAAALRPQPSRG